MVAILMMRAKSVTQGQLKIESFWNIRCDSIISVHDVTKKISCDQSLVKSSISLREVNNFGIIKIIIVIWE